MDDATWLALTVALTLVGAIYTWMAFRRRGVAAGLRGTAYTLLPAAAYLTDSMRMITRIVDAVGDWALGLVFRPTVWAGVILAGIALLLFVVSGFLRGRALGRARTGNRRDSRKEVPDSTRQQLSRSGSAGTSAGSPTGTPTGTSAGDDDLADIEAILRKRGIT